MKRGTRIASPLFVLWLVALLAAPSTVARAHFLEVLPSTDTLAAEDGRALDLRLVFTHPMAGGPAMALERPRRFAVRGPQGIEELTDALEPMRVDGQAAWRLTYEARQPSNLVFFAEPRPYWEPGEGKFIVHYAKVVVDAYGWGAGWDEPLGLPVEIAPLTRPYGLWTGNLFSGVVLRDGRPVPHAAVEVEWVNDGSVVPPADAFLTQEVRADANGVFAYAMPRAGWWGFAALTEQAGDVMAAPDGSAAPVERGGLIWVRAVDMK